jgi:hypothetical protein
METAALGALTPALQSLLTLALMPLGLLLACALVAGLGAVVLLFSRAGKGTEPREGHPAPPEAMPRTLPATEFSPGATAGTAGRDYMERRGTSSASSAEPPDAAPGATASETTAGVAPAAGAPIPSAAAKESLRAANRSVAPARQLRAQNGKRPGGSFQPGGRFSRSQQAFLRIPVALSGRNESGADFCEQTCTLILLPQGAVLPLAQRLPVGAALELTVAGKPQVPCSVFGAQTGPDGKSLVEIEFVEPQKNFWPVSFPAWAGELPADLERRSLSLPARNGHTAVLNESGS